MKTEGRIPFAEGKSSDSDRIYIFFLVSRAGSTEAITFISLAVSDVFRTRQSTDMREERIRGVIRTLLTYTFGV